MMWAERVALQLNGSGPRVVCDLHDSHPVIVSKVLMPGVGPLEMDTYDCDQFEGIPTYCPGNDDVSRTLHLYGHWEPLGSAWVSEILTDSAGLVIDVGCQIGWYSLMATMLAHPVLAIDAVAEHVEMTKATLDMNGKMAATCLAWLDDDTPEVNGEGAPMVTLMKVDIEGAERHALRVFNPLIEARKIKNITLEMSPVFNDSYEEIIRYLDAKHYSIFSLDNRRHLTRSDAIAMLKSVPQFDLLFRLTR